MKTSRWSRWPLGVALVFVAALVNANAPVGRYVVANGTVKDTKTGLIWQQVDDGNPYAWANAKTYCASVGLPGSGWRLPTIKELQTVVDDTRTSPAIDPTFTSTPSISYWSASALAGSSLYAWYVNFKRGDPSYDDQTSTYRVRCVR